MINEKDLQQYILETVQPHVYVADIETDELYYINPVLEKLLRVEKKDWLYKKYYDILETAFSAMSPKSCDLIEDVVHTWRAYLPSVDKFLKIKVTLKEIKGKKIRFGIAQDITENVQFALNMENKLKEQDIFNSCLEMLLSPLKIETAIDSLLEMLCDYYQADRAHIVHIPSSENNLLEVFQWNKEQALTTKNILNNLSREDILKWFAQYPQQEVISLFDKDTLEKSSPLFAKTNIQSYICTPLYCAEPNSKTCEVFTLSTLTAKNIMGFIGVINPKVHLANKSLIQNIAKAYITFYQKNRLLQSFYDLSHYDSMTKLLNRNSFEKRYKELSKQNYKNLGVINVDINALKYMNDTNGHEAGDELIRQSAHILKSCFQDNVYRTGGDEFMVLIENILESDFKQLVKTLKDVIAQKTHVSMSIGYFWNDGSMLFTEHIKKADVLMYQNKQQYYSNSINCRRVE